MSDDVMRQVLASLESLHEGQSALRSEVGALRESFVRLESDVGTLRNEVGTLRNEVGALREGFVRLEDEVIRIERETARMEDGLGRLNDGQTRLRVDVMARMDRLQDTLNARSDGEIVSLGVGERAERLAQTSMEATHTMAQQIGALFRLCRRLESEIQQLRGPPEPAPGRPE